MWKITEGYSDCLFLPCRPEKNPGFARWEWGRHLRPLEYTGRGPLHGEMVVVAVPKSTKIKVQLRLLAFFLQFLHFLHFLPSTDLFDYYYFWSATLRWCDETNNILRTGCWMTCRMLNDMRHEQFPKTKCITWTVPEVAAPTRTEQTSQSVNRLRQSNIAIENGP